MNLEELKKNMDRNNPNGPYISNDPIPNALDNDLMVLMVEYIDADERKRLFIENSFVESNSFFLHKFSKHMAELTVREKDEKYVLFGLVSLLIEGWKDDHRVSNSMMALLFNSSKKLGLNPDPIFMRAANMASPKIKKTILRFLEKPSQLQNVLYEEASDEYGFIYKRTW